MFKYKKISAFPNKLEKSFDESRSEKTECKIEN